MHQKVNEPVDVLVAFANRSVQPLLFKWGAKRYKISKVNLVHNSREGQETIWHFAVSSQDNSFVLGYRPSNHQWRIEEIFVI